MDELLDWSQNNTLPIPHEDNQKVNSSVKNAVNSQVGKMTISEDIWLFHFQASVFCAMGSCTKWYHGRRDEDYAQDKHGLSHPQADSATVTAQCLICYQCKQRWPIITYFTHRIR